MPTTETLKTRRDVNPADTWDLASLFTDNAAWEAAFAAFESRIPGYAEHKGKLGNSAASLLAALQFDLDLERQADKLGTFAFLKSSEDVGDGAAQSLKARYLGAAAKAAEAGSWFRPELLAIPDATMADYLADATLVPHKLTLERLLRFKPHTLGEKEERLLALQIESAQTAHNVFEQLNDADLKFGIIEIEPGRTMPLSHGSYMLCLEHHNREVRKTAFHQYYAGYAQHANTFAAALSGSIRQDIFNARARGFSSARTAAMFPDMVPDSIYDNLCAAVRANLPAVHKYYELRKRAMKLPDVRFYDIYTPILSDIAKRTTWDEAVELVIVALAPLGADYGNALAKGLRGRWCDRYENQGKHSGAFSSGCYDSEPYILMNYQEDVLDHVYTLAHEAGHSMHSFYSKSQPYQYSQYTIFVAEVASTFNEQLLSRTMMKNAADDRERAYFLNREIDDIRRTLVRQTMFAEFEKISHELAEANEALTLDRFKSEYRKLLEAYFGPNFVLDDELSLECLRIPHFYRAFYVYKYATGLSAAMTLADCVANGGQAELDAYLSFLRSGSSNNPLDLLRDAGVDMESSAPVDAALARFSRLVDELDALLN